ncbi:MAG: hypothetical protein M5U07_15735 [Xanthobacteraceae bacterium]|nr:hypothetical protein [Xanthobacteraceae bacterium]
MARRRKRKPRLAYVQVTEGDWIEPAMRGFKDRCCGCGLVHVVHYRVVGGRVQFRAAVDARATAAVRRAFRFTPEP